MAKNTSPKIDLTLSPETLRSIEMFRNGLAASAKDVQSLKTDLKKLEGLTKALKVDSIFTPGKGGSLGQRDYLSGVAFQQNKQIENTKRLGTEIGRQVAMRREELTLAKQGLNFVDASRKLEQAKTLNISQRVRTVKQINDLEDAQNKLAAARLRIGIEAQNGNTKNVRKAQELVRLIEQRVTALKEEVAQRRKAAQEAKKLSDAEVAERSRKMNMQRLFGDNGAGLFTIQAGLAANYMIMNQARQGVSAAATFAKDLDEALHNLQAITRTTDGNMVHLKDSLIETAQATKFTAVEVADAAVTLGQAGLSTDEIEASAKAVTLLATAAGADLPRAVDVATSVLGVFNMQTSQVATVADTMTQAINTSKLNLEKLTLGLQYSGNLASQNGVQFQELTAALGAMANAGIRSGSTLGTGMRQVLVSLMNPSEEFKSTLERLGLSMADVDVKSQGLYGALANLKDAGFTAADAVNVFEVRAAAAYNALSGNLTQMLELQKSFEGSAAATKANATQMRSFSNQLKRLGSAAGAVSSEALNPLLLLTRDVMSGVSDILEWAKQFKVALQLTTTAALGFVGVWAGWRLSGLLVNLAGLAFGVSDLKGKLAQTTAQALASSTALGTFGASARAASAGLMTMNLAIPVIGAMTTALGLVGLAMYSSHKEASRMTDTLDQAQTAFDKASGEAETMAGNIGAVDDKITELLSRYDRLHSDHAMLDAEIASVKNQFYEMGLDVTKTGNTVDDLIGQLQALRNQLNQEYALKIKVNRAELDALGTATNLKRLQQTQDFGQSTKRIDGHLLPTYLNNPNTYELDNPINRKKTQAALDTLRDPNASVDEVRMAKAQLMTVLNQVREMQNILDEVTPQGRMAEQKVGESKKRLDELATLFNDALETAGSILDTANQQAALASKSKQLAAQQTNIENRGTAPVSSLYNDAEKLRVSVRPALLEAGTGYENDAIGKYDAMKAQASTIEEELKGIQDRTNRLAMDGKITAENQQQIQEMINIVMGEITKQLKEAAEGAGKIEEDLAQAAIRTLNQQMAEQKGKMSSSNATSEQAKEALKTYNELLQKWYERRKAEIEASVKDVQLKKLALEELDKQMEVMKGEADEAFKTTTDRIAKNAHEQKVEAAKAELDAAKAAVERSEDLIRAAKTAADKAKYFKQLLDDIKAKMAAALKYVGLKYEDNPEAKDAAIAEVETENKNDNENANTLYNKPISGSGRGSKRDPIEKWAKEATDQVKAIMSAIKSNVVDGPSGVDSIQTILQNARDKMQTITNEIGVLSAKKASGADLTSQEQERLNTLLARQGYLVDMIKKSEEELVPVLYEQGRLREGLTLQLEQFAEQNWNLAKAMQDGMQSVFSNMTSSLTEFFTAWSDGTKSGKEAFKDLAVSVIKSLQGVLAKMLAIYLLQRIMGFIFPNANIPQQSLSDIAGGMFGGMSVGGDVKKAAAGTRVRGKLNRDSQLYELMDGEYVLRRSAAQAIGYDNLDKMNAMGNRTVASTAHQGAASPTEKSGAPRHTNIYLVDERSKPTSMGPNDVLAVVSDDMARGGTTKKLIKSIVEGNI